MSLYYTQKLLYELNRNPEARQRFLDNKNVVLERYDLNDEEKSALKEPDIGLLYVMGVNGQILMHYAAMCGYQWPEYIQAMRDGLEKHGQVRNGLYVTTDGKGAI
ncbi:MAG: aromatic ring-opening dioxygenase subunit LigA [Gammaproteobacteria bacterium]|nr:aromatic ring-opening dioxygenase subunit LigA [Pseudomonadota bacterium]MCH9662785.1 aromatic ring-opening dioxygenase subunit LigA [Gammaproteobacteria bacterium]